MQNQTENSNNEVKPPLPNTSGMGKDAVIPDEIKGKFNWGAPFWGPIWGIGNKTYISFLTMLPFVGVFFQALLLIKGNEWAWRNKHWDSVEHFKRVQRKWTKAFIIFGIAIFTLIGVLFALASFLEEEADKVNIANTVIKENPNKKVHNILDTNFVLAHQASNDFQELYEFVPQGQAIENWEKLITIIRDKSKPRNATLESVDKVAETTLQDLEAKGAFIYNAFTYEDPEDPQKNMNVITAVFSEEGRAEVNIKKIYLNGDNYIIGATYGVRIYGETDDEIEQKVNDFLEASDVGIKFISAELPEPWK